MKYVLFALFTYLVLTVNAQTPVWEWTSFCGESEMDVGRAMATDAAGNIYVTGLYYSSSITFGDITLASTASSSLFLVKYDADGNILWAKTSAGSGDVSPNDIALDADGNIYVVGDMSTLSLVLGDFTLTGMGSDDAFIAKYDPDGNVTWAMGVGTSNIETFYGVACDDQGNILLTGNYNSSQIVFGSVTITNEDNALNGFVVKCDSDGNGLWGHDIGGEYTDRCRDVAVDSENNVYITGEYGSNTLTIEPTTLTNVNPGDNVFLVKFDSDGNMIWTTQAEAEFSISIDMAIDANDDIYITGYFAYTAIEFDNITLVNGGEQAYQDLFVTKYDNEGNVIWANSATGQAQQEGRSIAIDSNGNVCVAGVYYTSSAIFGDITIENAGQSDLFVVSYAPNGDQLWVVSTGAAYEDYADVIATGPDGAVYITGFFDSPLVDFGDHDIWSSNDGWNFYMAKLGPSGSFVGNSNAPTLSIYPNPLSENATLRLLSPAHNATLIIENTFGQRILEKTNLNGEVFSLSRNGLPAGMYSVKIVEEGKVIACEKVVVND